MGERTDDVGRRMGADKIVDLPELGDRILMLETSEFAQHRIAIQHHGQPPACITHSERLSRLIRRDGPHLDPLDKRPKPGGNRPLAHAAPGRPVPQ